MSAIKKYLKNKYGILFFFIAAFFLFYLLFYFLSEKNQGVDIFCRAYLSQEGEAGNYMMTSGFIFNFKKNGTARISIDGTISFYDQYYTVKRDVDIKYKHIENDIYQLSEAIIFKTGRDDVPNNIIERNFFSVSGPATQFFTISKMGDVWLIGNLHAPGFICRSNR